MVSHRPTRRGKRSYGRALRMVSMGFVAIVAVTATDFARFAHGVSSMTVPSAADLHAARPEAIAVLTGGRDRIARAFDLLREGHAARLLISGVNEAVTAADILKPDGASAHLVSCCVDIDREATNTAGNATHIAVWARANGFERLIVVTSGYHIPRSLLELRAMMPEGRFVPYPVLSTRMAPGGWMSSPAAARLLFTEYAKYTVARALSWTRHADRTAQT